MEGLIILLLLAILFMCLMLKNAVTNAEYYYQEMVRYRSMWDTKIAERDPADWWKEEQEQE